MMDIRFQAGGGERWKAEAVLAFFFEGEKVEQAAPVLEQAVPWLSIAPAWRDFRGKKGEMTVMYGPAAMDIPRVIALGLGDREKAGREDGLIALRHAVGGALRLCRDHGLESVAVEMSSLERIAPVYGFDGSGLAREIALAALLGLYRYERWLSVKKDSSSDPRWLAFLFREEHVNDAVREAARLAEAEAAGLCLARDLANGPANEVTPAFMASTAEELASRFAEWGMSCHVLGPKELEERNMGAFLAVSRGSEREPRLVVLEYSPRGAEGKPLALVGKGITFDSGGISLKPSAGMAEMKGDMSGAAAVMGVFEALGRLAPGWTPPCPVVGLMPCTENMPGGRATRPGDIVVTMSGRSIEIVNTDAEGRLILADALTYAQKNWNPCGIVDIATLTGACAVALGKGNAGLFANDDTLADLLHAAGCRFGERNWRLPVWESSREILKSNVADMVNSGAREGGALHAAFFLSCFVEEGMRWAHLDIAAADTGESPVNVRGATGFGVRTLLDAVRSAQQWRLN